MSQVKFLISRTTSFGMRLEPSVLRWLILVSRCLIPLGIHTYVFTDERGGPRVASGLLNHSCVHAFSLECSSRIIVWTNLARFNCIDPAKSNDAMYSR